MDAPARRRGVETAPHDAHLLDDLPGLEVAREPHAPGRAERAAERAAHLRAHAHREAPGRSSGMRTVSIDVVVGRAQRVLHERVDLAAALGDDLELRHVTRGDDRLARGAPDARARRRRIFVAMDLRDDAPRVLETSTAMASAELLGSHALQRESGREKRARTGSQLVAEPSSAVRVASARVVVPSGAVFGFSLSELIVVIVVALVVIGPKDLPKMLRKLGQYAGKLRRMASDLRAQSGIDDALRTEGLADDIAEIRKLARGELDAVQRVGRHLGPDRHAPRDTSGSSGYRDDFFVVRDREYPRDGADSYGALPDNAIVYAEGLPEVEARTRPALRARRSERRAAAGAGARAREARRARARERSRARAPSIPPRPRRRIPPRSRSARTDGNAARSQERARSAHARRSRGRREDDDLGAPRRAPQAHRARRRDAPRRRRPLLDLQGAGSSTGSRKPFEAAWKIRYPGVARRAADARADRRVRQLHAACTHRRRRPRRAGDLLPAVGVHQPGPLLEGEAVHHPVRPLLDDAVRARDRVLLLRLLPVVLGVLALAPRAGRRSPAASSS